MKVSVRFEADYNYKEPVSFSTHRFRLFPRTDHFTTVLRQSFATNEGADVQYRRDLFDNPMAVGVYAGQSACLVGRLSLELEIIRKNAFHFLLAPHATEFPFHYEEREREVLAAYLVPRYRSFDLGFWRQPREPAPAVSALVELNRAIHEGIEYERRETGPAFSPAETIARGSGSCRDYTVLLAETLRAHGVAARMASGYLCEFESEQKTAEGALHAWVEAYLPGAGWVGLDPTNGTFCNHNHITAAVGLSPEDVVPIAGNYYKDHAVESVMTSRVEVIEI